MVAPRAGFEPAALGLEGRCSIQLSYRSILYYNPIRGQRQGPDVREMSSSE